MDETKPVRNQNDEEMDLAQIPQNFENKMNELASDAFEKMSKIVDKATEISNSEIAQKQREIENKTAVLGALNSADTALQVAMKTQQIVKNLEEKQKNFEEEFLTKSEKMIQEAVDKKFEEEAEINGEESDFADVEEFIEQEDEVTESEPEFADVDELCSQETENDVKETEFAEVSEFVESENDDDENTDKEDVCDFKNLRAIFEYLPENGKDSFVSNRIRMVVEYVIAKTSGKRGLLKTAKMWRKAAHLDNDEIQNDEDKVTAREFYDLVVYLKTLANELEDKEISKAICESADNVLQRIQL